MILTCPSCAASYSVADGAVPPQGRAVRCAACGHNWQAKPDHAAAEVLPLADVAAMFGAPEPAVAAAGSASAPLPKTYRAQAQAHRATREAMAAGVVWAMLGACFLTVIGGAALFRVQVVRLIPAAAGAYAAVHLPVNPTGLALENVQGGPALQAGSAVIVVTGVERNIETGARVAAPLKVQLIDKAGREVAAQPLDVSGGPIGPGETRGFKAVFENPPINAAEFQVDFDFTRRAAPAPMHKAPAPVLRAARLAPEPVVVHEAAAVPADSPYALPQVAAHNGSGDGVGHDAGHHP